MKHNLAEFVQNKKLVSIRRSKIDDQSIQGFILAFSDDLFVIQYVYDFRLDGLMVLRTADITEIKCGATNELQTQLLAAEQLLQQIPFGSRFDLQNWKSILTQLSQQHGILILEDELNEDQLFLIGKVQKITSKSAQVLYFSGAGNWDEKPSKLSFSNITTCQVDNNYINVYQRYFDRCAQSKPDPYTP